MLIENLQKTVANHIFPDLKMMSSTCGPFGGSNTQVGNQCFGAQVLEMTAPPTKALKKLLTCSCKLNVLSHAFMLLCCSTTHFLMCGHNVSKTKLEGCDLFYCHVSDMKKNSVYLPITKTTIHFKHQFILYIAEELTQICFRAVIY